MEDLPESAREPWSFVRRHSPSELRITCTGWLAASTGSPELAMLPPDDRRGRICSANRLLALPCWVPELVPWLEELHAGVGSCSQQPVSAPESATRLHTCSELLEVSSGRCSRDSGLLSAEGNLTQRFNTSSLRRISFPSTCVSVDPESPSHKQMLESLPWRSSSTPDRARCPSARFPSLKRPPESAETLASPPVSSPTFVVQPPSGANEDEGRRSERSTKNCS